MFEASLFKMECNFAHLNYGNNFSSALRPTGSVLIRGSNIEAGVLLARPHLFLLMSFFLPGFFIRSHADGD